VLEQRDRRHARRARQVQRASTWSRPAITRDHFGLSSSFLLAQPSSSSFTPSSHHAQSVGCLGLAHPGSRHARHDNDLQARHWPRPSVPEAPPAPNVPEAAKARTVPCTLWFRPSSLAVRLGEKAQLACPFKAHSREGIRNTSAS
jgi:hypothetical protein